jgi:hypothetical protein
MGRDEPALNASKKFRTQIRLEKTPGGCVSFSGLAHRLDDRSGPSNCGDKAQAQI